MSLSPEEVSQIAVTTAREIIERYHHPESIAHGLAQSMGEEFGAVRYYERRSNDALNQGDNMTGMLYLDIAGEEAGHYIRFAEQLGHVKESANVALLAISEGDPLNKFCCRHGDACAPAELLGEGKFPERIVWLREHYQSAHPGEWGKHMPASYSQRDIIWHESLEQTDAYRLVHGKDATRGDVYAFVEPSYLGLPSEGFTTIRAAWNAFRPGQEFAYHGVPMPRSRADDPYMKNNPPATIEDGGRTWHAAFSCRTKGECEEEAKEMRESGSAALYKNYRAKVFPWQYGFAAYESWED